MGNTKPDRTFLDVPYAETLEGRAPSLVFLGIPFTTQYGGDTRRRPCDGAPDAVRAASFDFEYNKETDHYDFDCGATVLPDGVSVVDVGDVVCTPGQTAEAKRKATQAVREIADAGAIPLIVGGDDALPPMVAAGLESTELHVLHIDAHLDFRDELAGIRDGYSSPIRRLREMPNIGQIVQVGLRGVGSARAAEIADARAAGNVLIGATELHAMGAAQVLDNLRDDRSWFVTIDCDGLDPSVAPGVDWPEPDGVTYGEAATLVRGLARNGRIAAIEFTEFVPEHDLRSLTALAICRLLMNVITLTSAQTAAVDVHAAIADSRSLADGPNAP